MTVDPGDLLQNNYRFLGHVWQHCKSQQVQIARDCLLQNVLQSYEMPKYI